MRLTLLDTRLLFDAPHRHPGCRLHPGASQDLVAVLYRHKQHTHTETYSQIEIIHSIIFTNQILHKLFIVWTTKPSLSINTKNNCHLIQSLWYEMKFSTWINDVRYDERR
jgi:hypothetical protein